MKCIERAYAYLIFFSMYRHKDPLVIEAISSVTGDTKSIEVNAPYWESAYCLCKGPV